MCCNCAISRKKEKMNFSCLRWQRRRYADNDAVIELSLVRINSPENAKDERICATGGFNYFHFDGGKTEKMSRSTKSIPVHASRWHSDAVDLITNLQRIVIRTAILYYVWDTSVRTAFNEHMDRWICINLCRRACVVLIVLTLCTRREQLLFEALRW